MRHNEQQTPQTRHGIEADPEQREGAKGPACTGTPSRQDARRQGQALRVLAVLAAATMSAQPVLAQQGSDRPAQTVGEAQSPRQDGTTRSGAQRPTPPASAPGGVPKSEHDAQHPPGHKKGSSTPRPSDSGSILGTPK